MVYLHHYTPSAALVTAPVRSVLREFHAGVAVFYVLSGFLITWNYWDRTSQQTTGFWGTYILKRVARIQPVYLLLLLIWCLAPFLHLTSQPQASPGVILLNVTLLKGFFESYKFTGIMQAWSLTVEETFYLCAPLIFFLIRKCGFAGTQALLWMTGLILLAIGTQIGATSGFFTPPMFVILYTFFGRSFEFMVGIACGRWMLSHRKDIASVRGAKFTAIGILGTVVVLAGMAMLQNGRAYGVHTPLGMALNNLFLPLFIGVMITGLVVEKSVISKLLSTPFSLLLGRSSYALYLLHLGVLTSFMFPFLTGVSELFLRLTGFIIINAASIILYVLYERPANRLVRRIGTNWLGIGVAARPGEEAVHMRRRATVALGLLILLMAFWSLGLLPAPQLLMSR